MGWYGDGMGWHGMGWHDIGNDWDAISYARSEMKWDATTWNGMGWDEIG